MPQQSMGVSSRAMAASLVVSAQPATLLSCFGYNAGAAAFVQVHEATSLPADATVPYHTFAIAAADNFSMIIPNTGLPCGTGIVVALSSTKDTLTHTAANAWFTCTIQA